MRMAEAIALSHHEKWDGTGYPHGLVAEAIPLTGRITAIADVFDALCSTRPYKISMPEEQALDMIRSESGQHFDPAVVEAFLSAQGEILAIKHRFQDARDIGLTAGTGG